MGAAISIVHVQCEVVICLERGSRLHDCGILVASQNQDGPSNSKTLGRDCDDDFVYKDADDANKFDVQLHLASEPVNIRMDVFIAM